MQTLLKMMLLLLCLSAWPAMATDLPSADEIVRQINARDEGKAVSRYLTMQLTDRLGKVRTRETRGFRKYYGKDKRTVLFYLEPRNVKDTAFLTWDYADVEKDDDQWLYLPAMRKVRRISASDRGDYFLGTDLTYEDIKLESRVSTRDYLRKISGEDEVDGHHCYLLVSTPINESTAKELGYGKVEQCVDDEIWMVRRSRFWDTKGNPLKTSFFRDIRQVQGIWTQHRIEVQNHKTGHSTLLLFSKVDYGQGVADRLFTRDALRRGL